MISIDKLNENQLKAVEHIDGPCMVLAGPGSGKTRVITYRIANMVVNKNILIKPELLHMSAYKHTCNKFYKSFIYRNEK